MPVDSPLCILVARIIATWSGHAPAPCNQFKVRQVFNPILTCFCVALSIKIELLYANLSNLNGAFLCNLWPTSETSRLIRHQREVARISLRWNLNQCSYAPPHKYSDFDVTSELEKLAHDVTLVSARLTLCVSEYVVLHSSTFEIRHRPSLCMLYRGAEC